MKRFGLPLAALTAGAASALAFQPVAWWPLMILAIAALCELVARAGSLKKALLIGWLFGLGQFVVGLNWIATAFTYQAAMPAWLGWIAVVLLSLYLAVYPMLAAGHRMDLRPQPAHRARSWARGRLGDHRMASRRHLHRLRLESGRSHACGYAASRGRRAHRHLRPFGSDGPARRFSLARRASAVESPGRDRRLGFAALARARSSNPRFDGPQTHPRRPAQYRAAGQMAAGIFGDRGGAARQAVDAARRLAPAPPVLA